MFTLYRIASAPHENHVIEIKQRVYGKRQFVPHDQVFPLIVVYCPL